MCESYLILIKKIKLGLYRFIPGIYKLVQNDYIYFKKGAHSIFLDGN